MSRVGYFFNVARALWNYHHLRQICFNYPMIADVEVTNACNLNCVFCARDQVRQRGIGYMSQSTFNKIVCEENAAQLRHVRLFMHGEPLLHPRIVDFVRAAGRYAKTVGFTSNATLLTERLAERLLEAGLTTICFSFEGVSKGSYEALRVGARYEVVKANILNFLRLRNEINPGCFTSLAIIDCATTHNGLSAFKAEWLHNGINKVEVLQLHDWGGIHDWDNASATLHGSLDEVCFWPWWGLAVYWDGSVSPCCLYEQPTGLGNVNARSIGEIWNSWEYGVFRRAHLNGRSGLAVCKTCRLARQSFVDPYLKVSSPNPWVGLLRSYCAAILQLGRA